MATLNVHYQDMKEEVLEQAKKVSPLHKINDLYLRYLVRYSLSWTPSKQTKKSVSLLIKLEPSSTRLMVSHLQTVFPTIKRVSISKFERTLVTADRCLQFSNFMFV